MTEPGAVESPLDAARAWLAKLPVIAERDGRKAYEISAPVIASLIESREAALVRHARDLESRFASLRVMHMRGRQECDDDGGECGVCAILDCPFGEPLHYHHDGCPVCTDAMAIRSLTPESP